MEQLRDCGIAVGSLPGFFGCHRYGGYGSTVGREMEIGVLAGESDNGELIQIHVVFSFELISSASSVLGHLKGERPRSQTRRSALLGVPALCDLFGGADKAERSRVPGAGLE